MIKKQLSGSFVSVDVSRRTRKSKFFHQISTVIDWSVFAKELYKVCKRSIADASGRPAYNALVLFKMTLLQTWYNLSDYGVEEQVNDSLSCMRFCGLQLEDEVPDHSVVCRFRKALSHSGAWEVLLDQINSQRTVRGVLVKPGARAIIDVSITPTPRSTKARPRISFQRTQKRLPPRK